MAKTGRFQRGKTGTRNYRPVFLIVTEGSETEPQYFSCFRPHIYPSIKIAPHRGRNAPQQLLEPMASFIKERGLGKSDEAWIVVDKDEWTDAQLQALVKWTRQDERYNLAVSNPQFEFWLLLHFDNGDGVGTPRECMQKLTRAIPTFGKSHVECSKFYPNARAAIDRPKTRDTPPCEDWPEGTGTTVYRLVEKMITES